MYIPMYLYVNVPNKESIEKIAFNIIYSAEYIRKYNGTGYDFSIYINLAFKAPKQN